MEDLKLLCPDGGEAPPSEHERCHLAVVPANAVVVRLEDKCRVYKFLERVQVSALCQLAHSLSQWEEKYWYSSMEKIQKEN